jgi:putative transposase
MTALSMSVVPLDVEGLLTQRGIIVSNETVRLWCLEFGPEFAQQNRRQRPIEGDHSCLDEVFVSIGGQRDYL